MFEVIVYSMWKMWFNYDDVDVQDWGRVLDVSTWGYLVVDSD
jgi:hypothetical protein